MNDRGHLVTPTFAPQPLWVQADPIRLEQVFSNLLNNAAKYTEPRGTIAIVAEQVDNDVVVSVRDTGIGIPQRMLSRVFDLFQQGDAPDDRPRGGLGIGLTLVRDLVEMHGGRVQANSEGPDRGAEFVVRLPALTQRYEIAANTFLSDRRGIAKRLRVLVVDDNIDAAQTLAEALKLRGHDAAVAHDGPMAVTTALSYQPDLALLDLGLPGLDGYAVARRLRAELQGVRLIAISGYGPNRDRGRSQEAGFDQHLTKPVNFKILEEVINTF